MLSKCLEIGCKVRQNATNIQGMIAKSKYINLCSDILSGIKSVLVINCNVKMQKCLQFVIKGVSRCFVYVIWRNEK